MSLYELEKRYRPVYEHQWLVTFFFRSSENASGVRQRSFFMDLNTYVTNRDARRLIVGHCFIQKCVSFVLKTKRNSLLPLQTAVVRCSSTNNHGTSLAYTLQGVLRQFDEHCQ